MSLTCSVHWCCECNYAKLVHPFSTKKKKKKESTETWIPSKWFSSHHGTKLTLFKQHFIRSASGVPAKWTDSIARFDSWQLSWDILKCDCVQSCRAFALAGIGLFSLLSLWSSAVSERQLTVVCKARGENVRGHRSLPFIYFSLSLGLESDFFFFVPLFFGNYSFFFFSLYMWLLKRRLFMTSLCRLCFINDQLCGLGRGIVFIWHRLALVQSSSCREAERSQFCGFERCEKFKSPLQEPCIYNLHV